MGKRFDQAIESQIEFLKQNLESQNNYSLKFSEILQEMEIFQNEENEENIEDNQENEQQNPSNDQESMMRIIRTKVKNRKLRPV